MQRTDAHPSIRRALTAGAAVALATLAGCSSYVSRGIDDQGHPAEVVFPDIRADATLPEGTFPNLDNLRAVAPGLSKDQLYDLLGRPHFREGLFGVREWDYIFNFRAAGGSVTTCQYKVIFDKDKLARSFYWKPESCSAVLAAPAVKPAPAAPAAREPLRLSADALFAFDSAQLLPEGRRQVRELADKLRGAAHERIDVIGYTDRLGRDDYNQRLSQRRADAVRVALVDAGVDAARIRASGRGEQNPVVQCDPAPHAALVACLAPNRRVEIEVAERR